MRIAVTYANGEIFQHFGHTESFKFYDIEDGKIKESSVMPSLGSGHGALAEFLKQNTVDTLICGGIGEGAQSALKEAGIKLFGGVKGSADKAVEDYLNGELDFDPFIQCNHHGNGEHNCVEHSCGKYSCH